MKYFDIRLSGGNVVSIPSWPAQSPQLRLLEVSPRIRVPVSAGAASEAADLPAAGTMVTKGQILCDAGDASAPVALAPTSGRVVGASNVELLNGRTSPAVEIESDFEDRSAPDPARDSLHAQEQHEQSHSLGKARNTDLASWIERLRGAGVWADRPGSPNLLGQLHHALLHRVDTVICNVLDEDPLLRLNSVLAARSGAALLSGASLLARLTEAKNLWIVVEAGAPSKWWAPIRKLARSARAEVVPLTNDYPQPDPSLLLYTLLGRRLRPGSLPTEQRALVIDAATAVAIGRAIDREQAMLQIPLAIRDHLAQQTHYVVAPVGVSLRHVMSQLAPAAPRSPGDPWPIELNLMRGHILHENLCGPEAVVSGGDLTLHLLPHLHAPMADPCIRCAWCSESCPTRVHPAGLLEAAQRKDLRLARHAGLDSCIECGVCSYVCPSHLPLLAGIRTLKELQRQVT